MLVTWVPVISKGSFLSKILAPYPIALSTFSWYLTLWYSRLIIQYSTLRFCDIKAPDIYIDVFELIIARVYIILVYVPGSSRNWHLFLHPNLKYIDNQNCCWNLYMISQTLRWRHNDHDSVSNHQPHGCLLNRLFRRRSKKTSKFRVTGLCVGNSPGPVNSPHKGPVTRKMFPFDDVIMMYPVCCVLLWFGNCQFQPISSTSHTLGLMPSYRQQIGSSPEEYW